MEADKDIINRLKRVEGQNREMIRMIEEEKDCRSVIHQMNAAKTAIDRAIGYTVANHLKIVFSSILKQRIKIIKY